MSAAVRPGQTWRSLTPRDAAKGRTVEVLEVGEWYVIVRSRPTGLRRTILRSRMRPGYHGYALECTNTAEKSATNGGENA